MRVQVQAAQHCLRAWLHAVVAALQASWALVKDERAPVEQPGQHCLKVWLHVPAALCCLRQQAVQHHLEGMRVVQHHLKPKQAVQHYWARHVAITAP